MKHFSIFVLWKTDYARIAVKPVTRLALAEYCGKDAYPQRTRNNFGISPGTFDVISK